MEEKNLNFKNKNALVFFADPDTEVICKHLAEKNDLSIINGYDILNEFESRKKLKTHQKVFLFITTYNFEDNHIKEIEKFGFKNDKITLFTTYSLDADICVYAKEKGIKVILLPLFYDKLSDYLK